MRCEVVCSVCGQVIVFGNWDPEALNLGKCPGCGKDLHISEAKSVTPD